MSGSNNFYRFSKGFEGIESDILAILKIFREQGITLFDSRNTIKTFDIAGNTFNIKSFRPPHFINKVIYRYFRKSKAKRSFENAAFLQQNGFGTPDPVAFVENFDSIGLKESFYVSRQLQNVFEMKAVIHNPEFPEREKLIKLYTDFHYRLHQAGINFLDNTQGNTLFIKKGDSYNLYLVDLNRMKTGVQMSIEERIRNFARLTRDEWIMKEIATEYAALSGYSAEKLSTMLISASVSVFKKRDLKKRWKTRWKNLRK